MKILTREQMQNVDKKTIEEYGVPSAILMENAGIRITEKIIELYPDIKNKNICVLVGAGNNGGDGLVIARQLYNKGMFPHVYIIGEESKFKGNALTNLNIAKKYGLDISIIPDIPKFDYFKERILKCDFIIDAIFGTGLSGTPREFQSYIINEINESRKTAKNILIAVDIPSGMTSDLKIKSKTILKANDTICVALPKINMIDYPEKAYVGRLSIVGIGFPEELTKDKLLKYNLIGIDEASMLINKRKENGHKGTFGRVLVIAGSRHYSGAAVMSAVSSLKAGAGLVTLASVSKVCDAVRGVYPEIMCLEMKEDNTGNISDTNLDALEVHIKNSDSIIMGPGVASRNTFKLYKHILGFYRGKVIIDAGGIDMIAHDPDILKHTTASVVITPHLKEFSRIVNKDLSEIITNKIGFCEGFCEEYNVNLVLKSAVTLTTDPNGNMYYNSSGNNGMATAGSGDVLCGIIGGLSAQGYTILQASILGVYLHGLTGDIIASRESKHTLTATQIIGNLHYAFRKVISDV